MPDKIIERTINGWTREELLAIVREYAPSLPQSEAIEYAYLNKHIVLEEYKFLAKES